MWNLEIIRWYENNKRDLPWRNSKDPFHIWLSEIIMQQTKIEQGLPYYLKFTSKYLSISDLANETEENILKLWQGLGYYSRGRNLLKAANQIVRDFNGIFPQNPKDLIKIIGVGPYSSSAIASIAFEYPIPVVDGNVYRLISRMFEVSTPVPSEKARKVFEEILLKPVQEVTPSLFNQGIMELGSLICTPKNPRCEICPVQLYCGAYKNNTIANFPVKIKKQKAQPLNLNFLQIMLNGEKTYLTKRIEPGIWQGLFEFPNFESNSKMIHKDRIIEELNRITKKIEIISIQKKTQFTHLLTHKKITASYWIINVSEICFLENFSTFETNLDEINKFPVHRLMEKILFE
jgi:A/G-specific adenine glycosylase